MSMMKEVFDSFRLAMADLGMKIVQAMNDAKMCPRQPGMGKFEFDGEFCSVEYCGKCRETAVRKYSARLINLDKEEDDG